MKHALFTLLFFVGCGVETTTVVESKISPCEAENPVPEDTPTPIPTVTATPIPDGSNPPPPGPFPPADEVHGYGTFTPGRATVRSWSLFTTMEDNGCRLPMIMYAANGAQVTPTQARYTRSLFEDAVRQWAGTLDQNPNWRCKGSAGAFWQTSSSIPGTVSVFIDGAVQRSYALVGNYEIRLSPQYINASEPYAGLVVLHEMGHMVGLSDTYTEPGYQQPIGQPEGVMNNLYRVSSLTADDIKGANALYEYMNGRGEFCDDGYTVGGAYENRNQVAFCVPS